MSVWWQIPQYLAVGLSEVGRSGPLPACVAGCLATRAAWLPVRPPACLPTSPLPSGLPACRPAQPRLPSLALRFAGVHLHRPAGAVATSSTLVAAIPAVELGVNIQSRLCFHHTGAHIGVVFVFHTGVHLHRPAGAVLRPGPRRNALLLHGAAAAVRGHRQLPVRHARRRCIGLLLPQGQLLQGLQRMPARVLVPCSLLRPGASCMSRPPSVLLPCPPPMPTRAGALVLGASVITSRMDPSGQGWLPKDLNQVGREGGERGGGREAGGQLKALRRGAAARTRVCRWRLSVVAWLDLSHAPSRLAAFRAGWTCSVPVPGSPHVRQPAARPIHPIS